jgi:two-component system response regulator RegX3
MTARILVVEDEPAIGEAVAYAVRGEGYEVDTERDGAAALTAAREDGYDLVVLDVMLPDLSGVEVCRRLRQESDVPILMLTARDTEVDRVLGLEAGADDYVTKPFSMAELLSRIRAILRRRDLDRAAVVRKPARIGAIELLGDEHELTVEGRPVHLTPSEFKLVALLASEPGRVFTRREIVGHLWESAFVADERACDTHIWSVRRKIERDPARPERLVTVRGVGYKLIPA